MADPTYTLVLKQGLPRELVISDWKHTDGTFYNLTDGYVADLVAVAEIGDTTPLFTLAADAFQYFSRQLIATFSAAVTAAIVPLDDCCHITGSPASAPQYKAGFYQLRVTRAGVPYVVLTGPLVITLGITAP